MPEEAFGVVAVKISNRLRLEHKNSKRSGFERLGLSGQRGKSANSWATQSKPLLGSTALLLTQA